MRVWGGLELTRPRAQPPPGAAGVCVGGLARWERRDAGAPRRSPTASLAAGHAFGGKKGIFRLCPAEVPGCLLTGNRRLPGPAGPVPARCRCLHPPAAPFPPPPPPNPRTSAQPPPVLSITSRRPRALGTPWGWSRHPRGGCFFSSKGFGGEAAGLPGRNRNSSPGREQERREISPFPVHFTQRCVTVSCTPGHTARA